MTAFDDDYDRQYGIHSNIPECCVEHYISNRGKLSNQNQPYAASYKMCDVCIKEHRINKLHICTDACADFLRTLDKSDTEAFIIHRAKYGAASQKMHDDLYDLHINDNPNRQT